MVPAEKGEVLAETGELLVEELSKVLLVTLSWATNGMLGIKVERETTVKGLVKVTGGEDSEEIVGRKGLSDKE